VGKNNNASEIELGYVQSGNQRKITKSPKKEMTMQTYTITYTARDTNGRGFKPLVSVNGHFLCHFERNTKTARGAISKAKRIAENAAHDYKSFGNQVTCQQAE